MTEVNPGTGKVDPTTDTRKFKILELATQGWSLVERDYQNLTRVECDRILKGLVGEGIAPNRLKVALQDDPRYPTDDPGFRPAEIPPNLE